jgi:hypothetical protein
MLVQKWQKKLWARHKKLGLVGLAETHVIFLCLTPIKFDANFFERKL